MKDPVPESILRDSPFSAQNLLDILEDRLNGFFERVVPGEGPRGSKDYVFSGDDCPVSVRVTAEDDFEVISFGMAERLSKKAVRETVEVEHPYKPLQLWVTVCYGGDYSEAETDYLKNRSVIEWVNEHGWEEPLTLPGIGKLPSWPGGLGAIADAHIAAVAASTATPPDLAGVIVFGVASTVITGAVVVEAEWTEPANLYMVGLAATGEGKSPAFEAVVKPLAVIEAIWKAELTSIVNKARARQKAAELRLKHLQEAYARLKVTLEEVDEAAMELAKIVARVPVIPRLRTNESTPEALLKVMAEQKGRFAVLSDEGFEFFEMASRYSTTGKANFGIYLKGYDGADYQSDRVGRDTIFIEKATLTVALLAQPAILSTLGHDRVSRDRGVYDRFCWSMPNSLVGYRPVERPVLSTGAAWEELVRDLNRQAMAQRGNPEGPVVLCLTPEAAQVFLDWRRRHEPRLREKGGDLAPVVGWAAKQPGSILRRAAAIHVLRTTYLEGAISAEEMEVSLAYTNYFVAHAMAVARRMGSDESQTDAASALRWLIDQGKKEVSLRDVCRAKTWPADRTREAMAVLVACGWCREPIDNDYNSKRSVEKFDCHPYIERGQVSR